MKSNQIGLKLVSVGWLVLIGAPSLVFMSIVTSWRGFLWASVGIFLAAFPLIILWLRVEPNQYQKRMHLLVWAIFFSVIALILGGAPSGRAYPESAIQSRFIDNRSFPKYSLANLVPESEQINLGFALVPFVDRHFRRDQSRRVSEITMSLYRELESDKEFHEMGSVLGFSYNEILGQPYDVGHYYLYVPQNRPEGEMPALLFLHGSGGNFKTYTWLLSKFAEENGFVIVAPSYGFGNWDNVGIQAAMRSLEDAKKQVLLDESTIYLMGLSNGGIGASIVAAAHPEQFKGLIYLSPVFDVQTISQKSFQDSWLTKPMFVITGANDNRIPLAYVQQQVDKMKDAGMATKLKIFPNEDHFRFFSQPKSVLESLSTWIQQSAEHTDPGP